MEKIKKKLFNKKNHRGSIRIERKKKNIIQEKQEKLSKQNEKEEKEKAPYSNFENKKDLFFMKNVLYDLKENIILQ